jgi:hypothetical protein
VNIKTSSLRLTDAGPMQTKSGIGEVYINSGEANVTYVQIETLLTLHHNTAKPLYIPLGPRPLVIRPAK